MKSLDFNPTKRHLAISAFLRQFGEQTLRPASIEYDKREHEKPMEVIRQIHALMKGMMQDSPPEEGDEGGQGMGSSRSRGISGVLLAEELGCAAASLVLSFPGPGLGGAAIMAAGTPEQRKRWFAKFEGDEIKWGSMAITEPGCGSDISALRTTAVKDGDEWVLNGRKIFITNGACADVCVVWATIDPSQGRAGIRAFVVEKGTPGYEIGKLEKKLGIRASETAELVFDNCRIPLDNLLGEEEGTKRKGFKGVMSTFDSTRAGVAAMAVGIARASLEYLRDRLYEEGWESPGYGRAPTNLSSVDDWFIEMESQVEAARLLTHRAAWMLGEKLPNALEASMAKAKAGKVVVDVCAKCVELLGPLGVTRDHPAEMWLRDSKVYDIFEGTGQIQRLIIARRVLDYTRDQLQ